jgi:uncharacterized membrane protein (UPF0136 family)
MSLGQTVLVVLALLMLGGGFMGRRAGSRVSAYAGVGSAVLLLIALLVSTFRPVSGLALGAAVAGCLAIVFSIRFMKTKAFVPAGMLLLVSVVGLLLLVASIAAA